MRTVVQLSDSASRRGGGMFESIRGLCRGLEETRAWQPSMVALRDAFSVEDAAAWGATSLRFAPECSFGPGFGAGPIARGVREATPDIVHLHGIWGPASRAVSLLGRDDPRLPLVISPRGMLEPWALRQRRVRKAIAWMAWMRAIVRQADCLHALCEEEAVALAALAPGRPICVIPNGIDLPAARSRGGEPSDPRLLVFIGRLHPKKGLRELLRGWARAETARASGWRLVIAGWDDGGYEAGLKAQASSSGLGDSVDFIGPVFGNDKAALVQRASAFVLPSLSEGLPMAVLEAWSHGLPVLMTDECHLAIGFEAGAAVRIEPTAENIAHRLAQVTLEMSLNARREMGARGRALVEERFTWSRAGEKMANVYQWLLGGSESATTPHAALAERP